MFQKKQFGIVFNTIFSIAFSAALTLFVKCVNGQMTLETFLMGFVPSFSINFVLGSFIPLVKIGNIFAGFFVKNENSSMFYLLRMFMIVLIMTAVMSFLVMFSEIGFQKILIFAFLSSFPKTFVFAYCVGVCIFPLLLQLTQMLCSKDENT